MDPSFLSTFFPPFSNQITELFVVVEHGRERLFLGGGLPDFSLVVAYT